MSGNVFVVASADVADALGPVATATAPAPVELTTVYALSSNSLLFI